ncbi:MAG: hypothetical protein ACK5HS_02570 [Mycoplasmatales bacterium]
MKYIEISIFMILQYLFLFILSTNHNIVVGYNSIFNILFLISVILIMVFLDDVVLPKFHNLTIVEDDNKYRKIAGRIVKFIVMFILYKMLVLGFYQEVLYIYLVNFIVFVIVGTSLMEIISFTKFNFEMNES